MSDTEASKSSGLLTFLGSLGGILIFALIIWIAYIPNLPDPVNAQAAEKRQALADEARAAGIAKITTTEVIDQDAGKVRIPVEKAMEFLVKDYDGLSTAKRTAPAAEEAAAEAK